MTKPESKERKEYRRKAKERKAEVYKKTQEFAKELDVKIMLNADQDGYLDDAKLIAMLKTNQRFRETHKDAGGPTWFPVDSVDLDKMIKEILKWRRGMLTKMQIKRSFQK